MQSVATPVTVDAAKDIELARLFLSLVEVLFSLEVHRTKVAKTEVRHLPRIDIEKWRLHPSVAGVVEQVVSNVRCEEERIDIVVAALR